MPHSPEPQSVLPMPSFSTAEEGTSEIARGTQAGSGQARPTGSGQARPTGSAGSGQARPTGSGQARPTGSVEQGVSAIPQEELDADIAALLKRDSQGLVAAIIQQYDSGEVLMLGWMDEQALHRTLTSGRVTFFSRSRQEYWRKGDTSGHFQYVKSVAIDCDGDALLVAVDQVGAACHTGTHSCFEGRGLNAVVGMNEK